MKKNLYLILFAFTLNISSGLCTVVTIHNVGFTFSSDAVTIILGDTVVFSINNIHFAKEVSQATWNIDDSVSNGGFQTPFGGGTVILDSVKTYYYVCGKHFDMGMKGTITVTDPTGIKPVSNSIPTLEVFPNPASKWLTIKTGLQKEKGIQIKIFNLIGNCLYEKNNIPPTEYLDITGLPSGIYFVEVPSDNLLFEKKLVISR